MNQTQIFSGKPPLRRLPLHMGDKILKIPLVSLVPKSVSLCLSYLTSNSQKKNPAYGRHRISQAMRRVAPRFPPRCRRQRG